MTPAEFNQYAAEYGSVQERAVEIAKASSYWSAMLSRAGRFPSFDEWMNPPKPARALKGEEAKERAAEFETFKSLVEEAISDGRD